MVNESVKIGIAEFKIARTPISIITTGLGSCVGVCLWDPIIKIGGMVHIMLPDSKQGRNVLNRAKYADSGIELLIEELCKNGAQKSRLVAKIAGGAQMFNFPNANKTMKIGNRNIVAVKNTLKFYKIKLLAEDIGGNYGRTIEFFTKNGQLLVKSICKGVKVI
ncbi:MAG TPA: chemotaxis protein CheD [Clostridia bacterium]|jgi:chemotaxis protein CheD|nr:chemotaxis protein CheD [Clostridia bacterium]HHY05626.1 chemotaxis protein CheD [Clostridia bacterium]